MFGDFCGTDVSNQSGPPLWSSFFWSEHSSCRDYILNCSTGKKSTRGAGTDWGHNSIASGNYDCVPNGGYGPHCATWTTCFREYSVFFDKQPMDWSIVL